MTHLRLLPGGGTGRNVREEKKGASMVNVDDRIERLLDRYESPSRTEEERRVIEKQIAFLLSLAQCE